MKHSITSLLILAAAVLRYRVEKQTNDSESPISTTAVGVVNKESIRCFRTCSIRPKTIGKSFSGWLKIL